MQEQKENYKVKELICPLCNSPIEYTGDSDFNAGGELFYKGECSNKNCEQSFDIYEEKDFYDLWIR